MKRLLALILAAMMLFSLTACGNTPDTDAPATEPTDAPASNQALEGVEAPVDILTKVWESYGESEMFFAMGGDYTTPVDNAPGAVDISDASSLEALLVCPADAVALIDGAASLIHAMNANTFTGAAYHLASSKDADSFITLMTDRIKTQQWMCGFPDELYIAKVSDEYVVVVFGATDLIDTFDAKLLAAFEGTEVITREALNV